ncbi:MAG: hypothetical protein AABN34_01140 [Acidobacteriota bacterium]
MSSNITITQADKRGCLLLIAVVGFVGGIIFLPVAVYEVYKLSTAKEPAIPQEFLPEILDKNKKLVVNKDKVPAELNEVLVASTEKLQVAIEFEERESIRGFWFGQAPEVRLDPPVDIIVSMEPASRDDWDQYISGFARGFTPTVNATLRIDDQLIHKPLKLTINMGISYPVTTSKKGYFSNASFYVEREISLFPISGSEAAIREQHDTWTKSLDKVYTQVSYVLLFALCYVTSKSGGFLYREYKEFKSRREFAARKESELPQLTDTLYGKDNPEL